MLNSKRPCPFGDDGSRPFKRSNSSSSSNTAREKNDYPKPKDPTPVHIPIKRRTLDKIKKKVNDAMVHLDEAFELGKVVEKKYTKEILSCIGLLKVFLKAAKASSEPKSSPPLPSPKVTIKREPGWPQAKPIPARKPLRPKLGFPREGPFNNRPQRAQRGGRGASFSRPSWFNPSPIRSSFLQNFQSSFLQPSSLRYNRGGWGLRGRGLMRGRGMGGYGRGRGAAWMRPQPQKAPAKKYYCKVCKLDLNSIDQYTSHNNGKSHKQKLKNIGLPQSQQANSNKKEEYKYHCTICNIYCPGIEQWNAHKVGKKHKNKLRNAGGPSAHPKGKFYCSICLMDCTAQAQWDAHLRGKTHAANLAAIGK